MNGRGRTGFKSVCIRGSLILFLSRDRFISPFNPGYTRTCVHTCVSSNSTRIFPGMKLKFEIDPTCLLEPAGDRMPRPGLNYCFAYLSPPIRMTRQVKWNKRLLPSLWLSFPLVRLASPVSDGAEMLLRSEKIADHSDWSVGFTVRKNGVRRMIKETGNRPNR